MSALVNVGGDSEFYTPMNMEQSCSPVSSLVDMYWPSCKRARVDASFFVKESEFNQNQRPAVEVLPDECLFEIFRRLPGGRERSACACVSKRWLAVLSTIRKAEMIVADADDDDDDDDDDDGCLTRCLEGKKATDTRLAAIAVGTSTCGGLGKLSIAGSNCVYGVTDFGLSAIACGCPSLRALSLWNVPRVGDEGLSSIAKECHLLEKLDLYQCPSISNAGLIAVANNCPDLTTIKIESCSKIGNEAFQAIGKVCPKLQSISIVDCPLVGDHAVSSILVSGSSKLTKVRLQALNLSDFSLAVIGHYGKTITKLLISSLPHVSEKGFWVMGSAEGLKKLNSLVITSCRGITDTSLEAMGKGFTSLKQICVRKCCFISDNGLVAFAKAAGSLESLRLEECNRITRSGLILALATSGMSLKSLALIKCTGISDLGSGFPVISHCQSLRSLTIQDCPAFGSSSLAIFGKLFPQLEHLDLTRLYGISDDGLFSLLANCKAGLVKVNLSCCFTLTDKVISALARLHGETLKTLHLDGCRRITNASLVAIANSCKLLSHLDVTKCAITDSGIAALSRADHQNLQVLSLSNCSEITNKSLPFLKELGKVLVGLDLRHCNSISSRAVELLTRSLWRCDILS